MEFSFKSCPFVHAFSGNTSGEEFSYICSEMDPNILMACSFQNVHFHIKLLHRWSYCIIGRNHWNKSVPPLKCSIYTVILKYRCGLEISIFQLSNYGYKSFILHSWNDQHTYTISCYLIYYNYHADFRWCTSQTCTTAFYKIERGVGDCYKLDQL